MPTKLRGSLKNCETSRVGNQGSSASTSRGAKDLSNVFALWEEYRDETALKAHTETEHFARLVVNGIRRLAKERVAATVFPLD